MSLFRNADTIRTQPAGVQKCYFQHLFTSFSEAKFSSNQTNPLQLACDDLHGELGELQRGCVEGGLKGALNGASRGDLKGSFKGSFKGPSRVL